MYEMKPEYYTGIAAIDKEHTRLLSWRRKLRIYFVMILSWIKQTT